MIKKQKELIKKTQNPCKVIDCHLLIPLILGSITLLSPFWQKVALANPILYMVNAFRYGMLGSSDIPLSTAFIIILVAVFGLFGLALFLLRRGIGIRT